MDETGQIVECEFTKEFIDRTRKPSHADGLLA